VFFKPPKYEASGSLLAPNFDGRFARLAFQLTSIDYRRTNFRNGDLSVQQLRQLIREQAPMGQPKVSRASCK